MNSNCDCTLNIPVGYKESEHDPDLIRVEFKVSGSEYGLVLDRDTTFTLSCLTDYDDEADIYTLSPGAWDAVVLSFDQDLDQNTNPIASHSFAIIDKGKFDPDYIPGSGTEPDISKSERWSGVFPKAELNKLVRDKWAIAELKGDDNTLISRCIFYVLGG